MAGQLEIYECQVNLNEGDVEMFKELHEIEDLITDTMKELGIDDEEVDSTGDFRQETAKNFLGKTITKQDIVDAIEDYIVFINED